MKFEVGDEVIVILTKEEGRIIEFIDEQNALVEVRGVRFPANINQLDFPYFQRFSKKKTNPVKKDKTYIDQIPKEKQKPQTGLQEEGLQLSVVPKFSFDEFDDEVIDSLKIYLVNKTSYAYHFSYKQYFLGKLSFELHNDIPAFNNFYLHDIDFAEINDSPSFTFLFSCSTPQKGKAEVAEAILKPRLKQLFREIEKLKEKNEPMVSYLLLEKFPDKTVNDAFVKNVNREKRQNKYASVPARSIIDLHIEKLVNSTQGMSNFDLLQIQLDEFEKWFSLAVEQHLTSIVFIHGIGTGKLRDEIHSLLKSKKEVRYFVNQYDPRFGYGATEVFLQT